MVTLRSALNWTGGKSRSAQRILSAFPAHTSYDTFADVFCGACHVTFAKPSYHHLEAINDLNGRLINFWMQVRDEVERLQWKLETLPYSEQVFKLYRASLAAHETGDAIETAARWYYVNRCTIAGFNDSAKGWQFASARGKTMYAIPSVATSYHNCLDMLESIHERLQTVQIHNTDFARFIKLYESPRTLFYCDPPYFGAEHYYEVDDTPAFTLEDHQRLADLLNNTSAQVALSYYAHEKIEELYPASKWRRITWTMKKETSHINAVSQQAHEVLLLNYPTATQSLWSAEMEEEVVA